MTILDPNKNYVFERVENVLYAREMGSLKRICLGEDLTSDITLKEWRQILWFAATNEMLKEEIRRVKMLYYLLKQEQDDHG